MNDAREDQSKALALVLPTLAEPSAIKVAIKISRFICPPYLAVVIPSAFVSGGFEINRIEIINQADFELAVQKIYQAMPS
jgi:hypothetical protein